MEFDRAQAKRSVRQAMRMTRPRPMLVTLLFTLMASMSTGVLNGVLGIIKYQCNFCGVVVWRSPGAPGIFPVCW